MAFLGVDAGGTSIRAVLASAEGVVLGRARSGGMNFRSSSGDPVGQLAQALAAAAAGHDPLALAVGAAGAGTAGRERVVEIVAEAARHNGLGHLPRVVVPDLDIAFRAGSTSPDGYLLLSGTGAIAARYLDWEMLDRRDGLGWLLGDRGSGTWLGMQAVRSCAESLDGVLERGELCDAVLVELLGSERDVDPRQQLVAATDSLRPAALAGLAPLVLELFGRDPEASRIVRLAADHLVRSARATGANHTAPLVLAGGLLTTGPLARLVREHFPLATASTHPVVGACALAAQTAGATMDSGRLQAALGSW